MNVSVNGRKSMNGKVFHLLKQESLIFISAQFTNKYPMCIYDAENTITEESLDFFWCAFAFNLFCTDLWSMHTCGILTLHVHVVHLVQGGVIEGVEASYFPLTHAPHRGEVMRSSTSLNQVL